MEGGMRVPMLARWPGVIPSATECGELASTMDIMPTFLSYVDKKPYTSNRKIDGRNISDLLEGKLGAKTPHSEFFYYRRHQLQAVRSGSWKLHLPLDRSFPVWSTYEQTGNGRSGKLVNLATDQREQTDLSEQHPEIVARLTQSATSMKNELGHESQSGNQQRKALDVQNPTPRVLLQTSN